MSSNPLPPTAPIARPAMNEAQRNKLVIERQKAQIDNFIWQNCPNCEHWNKDKEECKQWNVRPPASIIVVGCENWFVNIPF